MAPRMTCSQGVLLRGSRTNLRRIQTNKSYRNDLSIRLRCRTFTPSPSAVGSGNGSRVAGKHEIQFTESVSSSNVGRASKDKFKNEPSLVRVQTLKYLLRVEEKGSFLNLATGVPQGGGRDSQGQGLSAQDMRNVTRLASDIIRWKRKLDFIIDTLDEEYNKTKGRKARKLDSHVRNILRMGAYDLYFLNKPAYIVNEYVNLAKATKRTRRASGVINHLLRRVATHVEEEETPLSELEGLGREDLVDKLGVSYSHPNWLVSRWLDQFGSVGACLELLKYNNSRPEYCLRTNPCNGLTTPELEQKLESILDVEYEESIFLNDFFVVQKGLQKIMELDLIQNGLISVQDVSAGLVIHLLDPQPGEEILDACAAPGGKFYYTASRMSYKGKLVALDASRKRMQALKKGVRSFPDTISVETHPLPFEEWSELHQPLEFDKVLLDAPCSGSGVLAKRADLRWRRTPQDLAELLDIQERLLNHAKGHVKVGGCLVYSTCSIDEEENARQVQKFLSHNSNFKLDEDSAKNLLNQAVSRDGFLQTFPHEHGIDGAFAARLIRIS